MDGGRPCLSPSTRCLHISDFLIDNIGRLPESAAVLEMPSNIEKEEIVECYTRMRDAHLQEAKRLSHCLEEFEKKWSVAEEDAAHPKKRRREKKGKKKAKHKKKAKYKKKEDGDEGGEDGDQRDGDEGEGGGDGDEKRDAEMKEKDLCSPRTESSPVPELRVADRGDPVDPPGPPGPGGKKGEPGRRGTYGLPGPRGLDGATAKSEPIGQRGPAEEQGQKEVATIVCAECGIQMTHREVRCKEVQEK